MKGGWVEAMLPIGLAMFGMGLFLYIFARYVDTEN